MLNVFRGKGANLCRRSFGGVREPFSLLQPAPFRAAIYQGRGIIWGRGPSRLGRLCGWGSVCQSHLW